MRTGRPQNPAGQLSETGELTRAAGEHNPPARLGRKRRVRQPVPHHFQNFFDPRLDDPHELTRARRIAAARARRRRPAEP